MLQQSSGLLDRLQNSTFADNEVVNASGVIDRLRLDSDPVSSKLWRSLSTAEQQVLRSYQPSGVITRQGKDILVQCLNTAIRGPCIYQEGLFTNVTLRHETTDLMRQSPTGRNLARLNRMLLEDVYPLELMKHFGIRTNVSVSIPSVQLSRNPVVPVPEVQQAMAVQDRIIQSNMQLWAKVFDAQLRAAHSNDKEALTRAEKELADFLAVQLGKSNPKITSGMSLDEIMKANGAQVREMKANGAQVREPKSNRRKFVVAMVVVTMLVPIISFGIYRLQHRKS